jgi:hypothetical protein
MPGAKAMALSSKDEPYRISIYRITNIQLVDSLLDRGKSQDFDRPDFINYRYS